MRALLGIVRKELTITFTTPIAYVVLALFTAVASLFFWTFLARFMVDSQTYLRLGRPELLEQLNFNDRVIAPLYVGYVQVIFLFVMPLLTMRLLAEERRAHTLELLLSSPVRPWQIVLGKYLAALAMVLALCSVCLVYPLLLQLFGRGVGDVGPLDWSSVWLGWLGLVLVGATCAAVGLFTSSLTESQVVAAVLGMMLLLLFWVARGVAGSLDGVAGTVLLQLSLLTHIESYARGLFSLPDLVYFASFIGLFVFLTHRSVEGLRWS